MPGISDSPNVAVNTAPLAAIGSEPITSPALTDFMGAFRSGFITVDDLTRRTKQSVIDTSNLKTTISANDLTRQKNAAELQLLPGQQAEAATQQQIQATTAPGRLAEAGMQTAMSQEKAREFEEYQRSPQDYIAKKTDALAENTYIRQKGPLPAVFTVKNPEKRPDFIAWAGAPYAEAAERGDSTTEDRIRAEYLRLFPEEIVVRKGSPEYAMALRDEVNDLAKKGFLSTSHAEGYAAGEKARLVAQGTAAGKATAGRDPEEVAKQEVQLKLDASKSKPIEKFLEVAQGAEQVKTLAKQPPSNANDIALLYSFIKSLDPGSVVRPGEIDLLKASKTIPENVISQWRKLKGDSGYMFTPELRQGFVDAAEVSKIGFGQGAAPEIQRIEDNARAAGVDPARILNAQARAFIQPGGAAPASQGAAGAPTKLPNGTVVPIGATVRNPDGTSGKWTGTAWVLVQ